MGRQVVRDEGARPRQSAPGEGQRAPTAEAACAGSRRRAEQDDRQGTSGRSARGAARLGGGRQDEADEAGSKTVAQPGSGKRAGGRGFLTWGESSIGRVAPSRPTDRRRLALVARLHEVAGLAWTRAGARRRRLSEQWHIREDSGARGEGQCDASQSTLGGGGRRPQPPPPWTRGLAAGRARARECRSGLAGWWSTAERARDSGG